MTPTLISDCSRDARASFAGPTGSARWKSCAKWPHTLGFLNSDTTTDEHDIKEQAEAVCMMLERDGLGGEGRIYPESTWVEQVPNK
jgi:hypothetical protein